MHATNGKKKRRVFFLKIQFSTRKTKEFLNSKEKKLLFSCWRWEKEKKVKIMGKFTKKKLDLKKNEKEDKLDCFWKMLSWVGVWWEEKGKELGKKFLLLSKTCVNSMVLHGFIV